MPLFEHAYLIPLLPLLAAILILAVGRWLPLEGAWIGILAVGYGLIHAVLIAAAVYSGHADPLLLPGDGMIGRFAEFSRDWFTVGPFRMELGVLIDGMSALMLVVVTLVSFLVQVYSLGYQHGKPRFGRYYAYLSLFTFSMLVLVVANNLFQFFVGWELVGVCSYLLIGFEFERPAAAYAGRKAFLTTRVGDLGFYLGILLLFTAVGTANFAMIRQEHLATLSASTATAIALLLFCGAVGKSAQMPLHVWLPDAMEGPTPVSALIHAATMVAAGVYLLARFSFVFALSSTAQTVVAWVGGLTALGAALSALTAMDIKKVLAYSTISQLGYMVLAMGVGSPQSGMFHLTTHAFFKALMFLGAGSVIHAVHTNDMSQMGGLAKKMPATATTFAFGVLAIAGFPFTAGFYSKESILHAVLEHGQVALFLIGSFTAFLTTFYMSRLFLLTFIGTPRDAHRFGHAHESGASMTVPLWILGLLALVSGFFFEHVWSFERWIPAAHETLTEGGRHDVGGIVLGTSMGALVLGMLLAYAMYVRKSPDPAALAKRWPKLHHALGERYFDAAYLKLIDLFVFLPARLLADFDYNVVDQKLVDGVGALTRKVSKAKAWFDDRIVDGFLVNGFGIVATTLGAGLRRLQSGFAQFYLLVAALGLGCLLLWALKVFG